MLTRRGFMGAAGALAVTAACTSEEPAAPAGFDPRDWGSVRRQFLLDEGYAQLAAFVFASHPAPVRAAIEQHRKGLDEDPVGYLDANEAKLDAAAASAAARHLATRVEQVACTDSTTMGLGLLYTGLRLAPGDEILTTEHDFYATHESLRLRAARDGATVRKVRLYADPAKASVDEIVGNLRTALTPRTKIVAITWVHSSTGVKLPVKELAAAVRSGSDALICLDAVHGYAAVDATPEQLGVDFLVSGTHKWLFGPRGTGVVWGSERGWQRFTPVIPSFDRGSIGNWMGAAGPVAPGVAATPGGYHSFEHRWALADAFAFHQAIGSAAIAKRTSELAGRLKDGLAEIKGVTLHTPRAAELSAGLVCCSRDGLQPGVAVRRLRSAKVLASATPYAQSYLRFGTSIATGDKDVDTVLEAMRQLR